MQLPTCENPMDSTDRFPKRHTQYKQSAHKNIRLSQMHGGALAQKASKQKELSDHKLVKASNKRHGGGYSACALDSVKRPDRSTALVSHFKP